MLTRKMISPITDSALALHYKTCLLSMPRSSNRSGHHPFKVTIRVRVSAEVLSHCSIWLRRCGKTGYSMNQNKNLALKVDITIAT